MTTDSQWRANGVLRCAALLTLAVLFLSSQTTYSQGPGEVAVSGRILTNIYEMWELPSQQRDLPYRLQTEMVIRYIDPEWNACWGECQGRAAFLPIYDAPTVLKAGQRIAVDGMIVPARERFDWSRTQIRVLEEGVPARPTAIRNLMSFPAAFRSHLVQVEGLIDRRKGGDARHVTFNFIADGGSATLQVRLEKGASAPALAEGDFVRIKCIYAPQFDRDGNVSDLALWVASPADVEALGSLQKDRRFEAPLVSSAGIQEDTPTNAMLHVRGVLRTQEQGRWITLWDEAGQVMVQSSQTQPLRLGDTVEAIGYPYVVGVEQCLRGGLYRVSSVRQETASAGASGLSELHLAEQVRSLGLSRAAQHPPVRLRAVVTWTHHATPFAFVQDASGGVLVANPKWEGSVPAEPGTIVNVTGEVSEGGFVPVVTNAVLSRCGYWNLGDAQSITLEEAMTGAQDGRWVFMRGFVRRQKATDDGLVRLDLSSSAGEFQAWVPASQSFPQLEGSMIQVRGVCGSLSNTRHQLTGIQIWVPHDDCVQVENQKPRDLFSGELRSLDSLRLFSVERALNQRIRTAGTVVLQTPGRYLYIQDGADSAFVLSEQRDPLQPGDRVEVVGFPGNEGRRFVLREAVYRRVGSGSEPEVVPLGSEQSLNSDLEGRLVEAEGVLLNVREREHEVQLLIHAHDAAFVASLDWASEESLREFEGFKLGSRVVVRGVCEVQQEEHEKARSFALHIRSARDVRLIAPPPWWTPVRLIWGLAAALGASVLALAWGLASSRKTRLLDHARADLQVARDNLELRVMERTRQLQDEMAAKERARVQLAETEQNLNIASQEAGKAEVATGVLHNVMNVLNSVNVAAGIVNDRLATSRVEMVGRAAALLQHSPEQLYRFLTEDPRGKTLPEYLEKLNEALLQENRSMRADMQSLVKNVEHIKVIVSMQQSYARSVGAVEDIDLKDVAEDALQINSAAYGRQAIQLVREFESAPRVRANKNEVLQILVNLINNARQALDSKAEVKQVTLGIRPVGPDRVQVSVADNGMGIAPENLKRMFTRGFTTRKDGHGFGLHSGAVAVEKMGGSLRVESDGPGLGATFILELPASGAATAPADGKEGAES